MKSIAWDIWLYCNYDCKFCSSKTSIVPKEIISKEKIIDAWKKVYDKYGRCRIYITGGEPFLYPNFYDIISNLLKFHDLHITTNLSFTVTDFINLKIDKKSVFINATFHPFYQEIQDFISKILILKKEGYCVSATYMSDDMQMTEAINYKKVFVSNNIDFSVVETDCKETVNNTIRNYLIDGFVKKKIFFYENKDKNFCNAGYKYLIVNSLGEIFVCSMDKNKIGNLFSDGLSFYSKKNRCEKNCILSEKKYY